MVTNLIKIIIYATTKKAFNTMRYILLRTPINTNNVLKLFYTEADINTFEYNPQLVVQHEGASLL
ncbi:MAG: hypothetical protein IJU54_00775 [Alphaproteobacteria bacterium]|nr:hypothetical protein [Alphaproteobacteria bacterium]